MKDPFPFKPPSFLVHAIQPWAEFFSLPTLPLHIHEVLFACLLYTFIYWPISPFISRCLVGERYDKLPRKRRVNWDAHVVSLVQSTLINALALWIMFVDSERNKMDWQARIWGYTGALGMIQALAAGYFLWDLVVTSCNMDVFGPGTLAHAVSALLVYSFGFRPFVNYYAPTFILWELSTPFLNIHWFLDKLALTGSRAQLYNGLVLIATFFSCRLVYGTYQSCMVLGDIWAALSTGPAMAPDGVGVSQIGYNVDTMGFAKGTTEIPCWLALSYLISNLILNSLNFYWFVMMIRAVRKRFQPPQPSGTETKIRGPVDAHTEAKPAAAVEGRLRRRKA
ncbi:DUF887 domain-containing protein [Sodiomyces alkalinus F11]|uniref:DUF887 domain-containing protein n=1 Tax=Sodiomyces alkalinus (strain CBS 110278 / VKM F-3762 / F11) TaxID=1314773 RepID=A0A3N2PRC6_SODAK|nr:DUF887 domain-containing protein [Sodiomyces alkalinus F11]ROT37045.1 DUF887 domain-containing protein [Sodiomyces alkalinus F11]